MEPIPSSLTKTYPARGPLRQFRFAESSAFRCFRCGNTKKAKLIAVYSEDWSRKLCNGCYGRLLSIYDIKAGTEPDHSRADQLANLLSALITVDQKREADREFCLADRRSEALSAEARHFIATAEYVAGHLETQANLEWSPAVIGLCKAIEMEVVSRVVIPLKTVAASEDLYEDKQDRDMNDSSSSRTCHTGFQYTPVASIATCVQPASVSQAASSSRPAVVVANSRCSVVTFRPAAMRTHAFTHREWTSNPAHRGYKTSIRHLLLAKALAWSPPVRNLQGALTGRISGLAIRGARGTPGPTKKRALGTIEKPTSGPAPSPYTISCFMNTRVRHRRVEN